MKHLLSIGTYILISVVGVTFTLALCGWLTMAAINGGVR